MKLSLSRSTNGTSAYPLIDYETDGTEKMPMFPVTDSKSIKAQSHLWLEEVVPHYYRLHAEANHSFHDGFLLTVFCYSDTGSS